jgi:polysaccharide biosynthesis protein PslG
VSYRHAFLRTLFVAALAAAAVVSQQGAAASTKRLVGTNATSEYGLHQDLTYDGYAWRRAENIAAASSVHAQISRNSLLWYKIEPEQGTYDWTIPDAVVSDLAAKGIEPLFVVWGSPSWANGVPSTTPGSEDYVPTGPAAFTQWLDEYVTFIKAAVARYRGRVEKWEIWNEENEHFTWKPVPNVTEYAVFFQAIRSAILSVDPQAQVAIGGLAGLRCSSDIPGLTFLQTLIDMKLPFDYVAIHPYSGEGQSPEVHIAWQNNFDDIAAARNLLVAAGRPVPLWATEWGWSSAQIGLDDQAQYVARSLALLKTEYPYVTVATYFLDVDRGTTYQQGLFDTNFNPKPAAAAFASFISSLKGFKIPVRFTPRLGGTRG